MLPRIWTQREWLLTPSEPLKVHPCGGRHPLALGPEKDPSSQAMETQLVPGGQPTLARVGGTSAGSGANAP